MKILVALLMLFAVTVESEARTRQRVTVYPVQRPIVSHPYAVDYVLS